jgi:hypothetical protein
LILWRRNQSDVVVVFSFGIALLSMLRELVEQVKEKYVFGLAKDLSLAVM